jgi:glycosyltransferase involved in cell wall biosynthesis
VHIFTAAHFGYKDPDPNTYRFPAIETPWTKDYPLAIPPFYPKIHHFRRHKFDIVHTHTPFTMGFVGLRWAQSHGIPVVSTYHTLYDKYAHYIPFFPKRYVRYKIAKHTNFYYNEVQHIITPSLASKKWLLRHSVHTPITVIPTGILRGKPIERAEARAKLGVRPGQRIVLYVGRIAKEKNVGALLSAFKLAVTQQDDLHFWLVGDGPYREECVAIARDLGIGDLVRFVGFQPREDVDTYYAAADLFAFASMTETQGLVVGEAMMHGLPSVVVQGGGASELVVNGENGFLVKNYPEQIAAAMIETFSDDQLYQKMSHNARVTVRSETVEAMVEQIVELYRTTIQTTEQAAEFVLR